jgi:hypothetical protein
MPYGVNSNAKDRAQGGKLLVKMGDVTGSVLSEFQEQYGGHPLQLRLHPSAKGGPPQVMQVATDASDIDAEGLYHRTYLWAPTNLCTLTDAVS